MREMDQDGCLVEADASEITITCTLNSASDVLLECVRNLDERERVCFLEKLCKEYGLTSVSHNAADFGPSPAWEMWKQWAKDNGFLKELGTVQNAGTFPVLPSADQEADTHEASQPRLLRNYPGNSVRLYMRDENGNVTEIAGREEYEADTPIVTEAKE